MMSILLRGLVVGILGGVFAAFTLKHLPPASDAPALIGQLNSMDVYVHVGDITVPNRVEKLEDGLLLDPRIRYWDSFLISAPVPRIADKKHVEIPWTLLPLSASETVTTIDEQFGTRLKRWLGLKNSVVDWHFDRLDHIRVPVESEYFLATSVSTIHAVNIFDFVKELGGNYGRVLGRAIASATKETIEAGAQLNDRAIAFPALAAAQYVFEKDMVVSYEESFTSILEGAERAKATPSKIVLVIWRGLLGHAE